MSALQHTIYFIRHGETKWNTEGRLQGQTDTPLNDTGQGQARRNGRVLAEYLAEQGIAPDTLDYVASPLGRTSNTMELVRDGLGLSADGYRTDDRLLELHFGDWEGRSWSELKAAETAAVDVRRSEPFGWQPPGEGGESYAQGTKRVAGWLTSVARDSIVVSHGGILRCLRGLVQSLLPGEIPRLETPQDKVVVITASAIRWV